MQVPEHDPELFRPRPVPFGRKSVPSPPRRIQGNSAARAHTAAGVVRDGERQAPAQDSRGAADLRRTLLGACAAMGRTDVDADRILALLQEEWLCDSRSLSGLSDDGWRLLRLPLGLKEELRRRLDAARAQPAAAAGDTGGGDGDPAARFRAAVDATVDAARKQQQHMASPEEARREAVLQKVQDEFRRRAFAAQGLFGKAGAGMRGLAHRFASIDDDNNKKVSRSEFHKVIGELQLDGIGADDLDNLWVALDADDSGFASFDEFVDLFGASMNERRRHAVRALFAMLDKTGDGTIQVEDIKLRYHPDAYHGGPELITVMPSDESIFEGLDNFRKNIRGDVPGVVRLADFEKYYARLGRNIDSDNYFEEMLTRAWRLPEGWLVQFGPRPRSKPPPLGAEKAHGAHPEQGTAVEQPPSKPWGKGHKGVHSSVVLG